MKYAELIHEKAVRQFKFPTANVRHYLTRQNNRYMSLARVDLHGKNPAIRNHGSEVLIYVLNGHARFDVNGRSYRARKGDLVHVPRNAAYRDQGNAKLIFINVPPLNEKRCRILAS